MKNPVFDSGDDWDRAYRGPGGLGKRVYSKKVEATPKLRSRESSIDGSKAMIYALSAFVVVAFCLFGWTIYNLYIAPPAPAPVSEPANAEYAQY